MSGRNTGPILFSALRQARNLAIPLALFALGSCGGSGGGTPAGIVGCTDGSKALCVTACNLGCSTSGCSLSNIAVNQRLDFSFNLEVDAARVTTNRVRIRGRAGNEPIGVFLVQGATISFVPEVKQGGGETFFGFTRDETYTLTIPSKGNAFETLRSTSGDVLASDFSCRLQVTLGIVDFDGQPPRASLLVPSTIGKNCIDRRDTNMLIEFSELIDPQTLTETSDGLSFRLAQADNQGNCSQSTIAMPGVRTISVDRITQRTRVAFRPAFEPPAGFCIIAIVSDEIRDLSGKRAQQQSFSFLTCAGDAPTREIVDDFSDDSTNDRSRGGAKWVQGAVVAPTLGGSGRHGDFNYLRVGAKDTSRVDAQDRQIWELNVDTAVISELSTLSGQDEPVVNGIFEFTSFSIPSNIHLQLVGTKVPVIRVSGQVDIQGVLSLPPETATKLLGANNKPPLDGQQGFRGAIGGGTGGIGADSPHKSGGGRLVGTAGESIRLPAGHPFAASAANTGGLPTGAWPASGLDKDVKFSVQVVLCQMAAAGGSGGSFITAGGVGSTIDNLSAGTKGQPYDFGPAGSPSTPVDIALLRNRSERSSLLYLLGGSGGGGSGTHASSTFDSLPFSPLAWSPGSGGAGGGGILHFQVGSDFNVGIRGIVSVAGGNAQDYNVDLTNFTNPPPGGAGSGGSLLLPVGGLPDIRGSVTAAGGAAGRYRSRDYSFTVDSVSGAGGDGLLRYESDPPPALAALVNMTPTPTADNIGPVHPDDASQFSVLATDWYDTGLFFPPKHLRYVIEATIDDVPTVFSDDSTLGRRAQVGEPIEILFQGAQLDAQTKRPMPPFSSWSSGTIDGLTLAGGNAFRVLLRFDRSKASKIVVNKTTYRFQG